MGIDLKKGGNISLTKIVEATGKSLQRVVVACGWDVNEKRGGMLRRSEQFDLDLTAACLDVHGIVPDRKDPSDREYQEWFIHANHRHPADESIIFMGDNRTGAGDGDDEQIKIDLTKVSEDMNRIVFAVVIWHAEERDQKFGNVQNAFIRVFDEVTGEEFARFNLGADFTDETLVVFGELYRYGFEWKFRAIGQGYNAAAYRKEYNIERKFELEYARFTN